MSETISGSINVELLSVTRVASVIKLVKLKVFSKSRSGHGSGEKKSQLKSPTMATDWVVSKAASTDLCILSQNLTETVDL